MTTKDTTNLQHTPGPYCVEEDFLDGDHLTNVCIPGKFGQPGQVIARCEHNWKDAVAGERRISWKEAEANAALFASAPDLLVELIQAREVVSEERRVTFESNVVGDDSETLDECARREIDMLDAQLARIDAAIAKAEGHEL